MNELQIIAGCKEQKREAQQMLYMVREIFSYHV